MGKEDTRRLKQIMTSAGEEAKRLGNSKIYPEHLFLGLLKLRSGRAIDILMSLGLDFYEVKDKIEQRLEGKRYKSDKVESLDFTLAANSVLKRVSDEAWDLGDDELDSEHVMLAILRNQAGFVTKLFKTMNIDYDIFKEAVLKEKMRMQSEFNDEGDDPEDGDDESSMYNPYRQGGPVSSKSDTPVLDNFGNDITKAAEEGALDPIVGRDREIERLAQILSRRKKNNPVLIGDPGVGKSAIAEGLALRIVQKKVSRVLFDKRVISLDIASIVAGTKYRGQFEERMKAILAELAKNRNIILFIDEIHTIVGAGGSGGNLDAANMLKPALARGEIQCIGATTLDEYRQYIEKDPALERRFQPVQVDEPTVEDTISILRGLKERYEVFHGVKINDSALIAAATLSDRYITDRFLPDKAIDLVDEACAMIKTEMDSMPSEMDDLAHRITQLQIEQVSLKKETDALSQSRLKDLEKELAELQDKFRSMKAKWENEKNAIGKVQSLREQIEQTNADIEKAQREYDLNKAAELKYGKLPQLQKQLEEEEKIAAAKKEDSLLRDRVTDEEIARIVARWTGIPVEKLVEGEREKLLHLDDVLHQRVIGQDEAVTKVSEAILRSRAGIANPNRPIGSFLFLGPTGVGKTELAKALAQALFDDERNMVRIDMTEYMEKFSVSRLIGAPPGYVGYEEGGQLTEAVRRKPYSVVLFDEVEKAHPDVFNILLQVLDDGRITDSQGRTVDFKNTVIILTSNLGSDIILNDLEQRRANGSNELSEEAKHQIDQLLKSKFRPEFLNRLDEIVYYKSLTKDEMRKIVDLQLQDLRKRMDEGKHLKLEVTTAAKDFIIDSAYDSVYGARPIKRFIQSRVETLIAKAIIQGSYTEGNTLTVDCENGALTLR